VNGALLATADPFLYTLSFTATEGVALPVLEEAVFAALEPVAAGSVTDGEVARAKRQLRARLVFEDDSVTNVAHQLGYFETVVGPGFHPRLQECIDAVTPDHVREAARARLRRTCLTVGSFLPVGVESR
jgi:zinc protease